MKTTTQQVSEFHKLFEHPIGNIEDLEPLKIRQLRIKLLFEELQELAQAGDILKTFYTLCVNASDKLLGDCFDGDNVNKIEELDAITDLQYVLDGKKLTSGLYVVTEEAFNLVHENNMQKAHLSEQHCIDTITSLSSATEPSSSFSFEKKENYYIVRNSSEKTIKPLDHKKVDLSHLFKKN